MAGHDYHWTFGNQCHIAFPGGGTPVNAGSQPFSTSDGCSSFSDPAGNLLIYTDGRRLYRGLAPVPLSAPLGGNVTSTHSAIIVPPAPGRSWYHIFGVDSWESGNPAAALTHTAVTVGTNVVEVAPPLQLSPTTGPRRASERLAAVQHADCDKVWVVALYLDGSAGVFHALRVDGDARPTTMQTSPYPTLPSWVPAHQFSMKFSPDGRRLALATRQNIDIFDFNRATGTIAPHSQITGVSAQNQAWGLEFSPDSKHLYFTCHFTGQLRRHTIGPPTTPFAATHQVGLWTPTPPPPPGTARLGALQLGPNGKIYGAKNGEPTLIEIGNPDFAGATPTPADVQFLATAVTTGGAALNLDAQCRQGLPNFVVMTADCADRGDVCARIAGEVDALIADVDKHNSLRPCRGELPDPRCAPLELPDFAPQVYIRWGDSPCDCIEGDDTEIMHLTVCNPYSNLTLSNLNVHQLLVVDSNGNPVPDLPSGDPSIELVPKGPYCFDDIAPCTCVTREFVLRLRGAPGGTYSILVRGICFDVSLHRDTEACFIFEVCPD